MFKKTCLLLCYCPLWTWNMSVWSEVGPQIQYMGWCRLWATTFVSLENGITFKLCSLSRQNCAPYKSLKPYSVNMASNSKGDLLAACVVVLSRCCNQNASTDGQNNIKREYIELIELVFLFKLLSDKSSHSMPQTTRCHETGTLRISAKKSCTKWPGSN